MINKITNSIKSRLISKFDLNRIILFGSQARGTAVSKSDYDLLIIFKNIKNRMKIIDKIDESLEGLRIARHCCTYRKRI
jgi:predicted nucleotidyltransferase